MGFQKPFAEESVKIHGTVQSALEALLAGNGENKILISCYFDQKLVS